MTEETSKQIIAESIPQEYIPLEFDPTNKDHVEIIKRVIPDMRAIEGCQNRLTAVWFRTGLLVMLEIIDYQISNMNDTLQTKADLSQFLLSDSWPTEWLGSDPGTPRKLSFHEIVTGGEEGPWDEIQPTFTASIEALPEALRYLQMIGVKTND